MEEQVLETWGKLTGGSNNAMAIKDSRRKSLAGRMAILDRQEDERNSTVGTVFPLVSSG
jgi:hypothetical protein